MPPPSSKTKLLLMFKIQPKQSCLSFLCFSLTCWAVVLFSHWTEKAPGSSLPSINLCHKSVKQRERELLNTDLSAINLTSITRLGYCVLYTREQWATPIWRITLHVCVWCAITLWVFLRGRACTCVPAVNSTWFVDYHVIEIDFIILLLSLFFSQ